MFEIIPSFVFLKRNNIFWDPFLIIYVTDSVPQTGVSALVLLAMTAHGSALESASLCAQA